QVGRGAVSQNVATRHVITTFDDRTLVDVGVLVGTCVLGQVVDVYTHFAGNVFVVVHTNNHALRVDLIDDTATYGLNGRARVNGHCAFDTGADQGLFGTQARHGLTLHVGTHQGPVGVVVLKERDQRCSHGNALRRCNVHVVYVGRCGQHGFT